MKVSVPALLTAAIVLLGYLAVDSLSDHFVVWAVAWATFLCSVFEGKR